MASTAGKNLLTIKSMSDLSGVSVHAIRVWEKRYGAFSPKRGSGGIRYFTLTDLKRARSLGVLTKAGVPIRGIAKLKLPILQKMLRELGAQVPTGSMKGRPSGAIRSQSKELDRRDLASFKRPIQSLWKLIREGQIDQADEELTRLSLDFSGEDFVLGLVVPIFRSLATARAKASTCIAREHLLSTLVRYHLSEILHSSINKSQNKEMILCATPEDHLHEMGAMSAAIFARARGHQSWFVGPDFTPEALADLCVAISPRVLVLGVKPVPKHEEKVPLSQYFRYLKKVVPEQIEIWVGGEYPRIEKLCSSFGFRYLRNFGELAEALENTAH